MLQTPEATERRKHIRIQCPFCDRNNPDLKHMFCNCHDASGKYLVDGHGSIAGARQKTIKERIVGAEIKEDKRIREICANTSTEDGSLKRPDLASRE
jgi:hypothetical protein